MAKMSFRDRLALAFGGRPPLAEAGERVEEELREDNPELAKEEFDAPREAADRQMKVEEDAFERIELTQAEHDEAKRLLDRVGKPDA